MALDPALAAVRLAVRQELTILPGDGGFWSPVISSSVMVACSGGADSLALLAATIFEVRKLPDAKVIGVVVDHGLQQGSAEHTARVVEQMAALGADETATIRVTVDPGPAGIEAGAREARYAALSQLAAHFSNEFVLLGHTLDDQAETVLLGLARGSGGRSLQGMRQSFGWGEDTSGPVFLRPLLEITRAQTEAACQAEGIEWWNDPHNTDPRFTRSRIRHTVMPMLERELGPGIAAALARTAGLVREDQDVVDREVGELYHRAVGPDGTVLVDELDPPVPFALITRVLRRVLIENGAIASELTREHVLAVFRILQEPGKQIQLPGHLTAYSDGTILRFKPT